LLVFRLGIIYRLFGIVAIAVLLFAPLPSGNLWWHEAVDSGHLFLFVLLSFYIYSKLDAGRVFSSASINYLLVIVIGMLLGVFIESLQEVVQRDNSVGDLYGDLAGLLIGVCLIIVFKVKKSPHQYLVRTLFVSVACVIIFQCLGPLLKLSWHYVERQNAFPVIADFGASWSSSFVRLQHARISKNSDALQYGSPMYRLQLEPAEYSGIAIIEPKPDWSGYQWLHFKIFSMNSRPYFMTLRVNDLTHNQLYTDRFNEKLLIQPGLNRFAIPLDQIQNGPVVREMDLKKIVGLMLFIARLDEPLLLLVSNISLD